MKTINDDSFEYEVLRAEKPVLLEFFSDGCVPCKRMSPVPAELEEEYSDVIFAKLNVNFSRETAKKYTILSSPTFLFFRNGAELGRLKGVADADELADKIEEVLL